MCGLEDACRGVDGRVDHLFGEVIFARELGTRHRRGDVHDVVDILDDFVKSALSEKVRDDDEAELLLTDVLQSRVRADGLCFRVTADHSADFVAMLESLSESCEANKAGGTSEKNEFACHCEECC